MPRKAFKCVVEITIQKVSSPGTWLPNRDDLYLTIDCFNQIKRTCIVSPTFPLTFQEKIVFEKIFWSAVDPQDVAELLEDIPLVVEVRQITDVYLGGTLLAYLDTNARDFLYPTSAAGKRQANERTVNLIKTVDFPGMIPKLEYSTFTLITETTTPYLDSIENAYMNEPVRPTERKSRSRNKSGKANGKVVNGYSNYARQTVSAAIRSQSPDAEIRATKTRPTTTTYRDVTEPRAPFVVRHVTDGLTKRQPMLYDLSKKRRKQTKPRPRSVSPSRYRGVWIDYTNTTGIPSGVRNSGTAKGPRSTSGVYSRKVGFSDEDDDKEVDMITSSRARSPSPSLYRSSLRSRFSPVINEQYQDIHNRVNSSLAANRSPSPRAVYESSYEPPRRQTSPHRFTSLDSLDQLEMDLIRAKNRRFVY